MSSRMKWVALAQTLCGEHCSSPDAIPVNCQVRILRAGWEKSAGRRQYGRKESLIEAQTFQNALLYQFQFVFADGRTPADLLIPTQSPDQFQLVRYSWDEPPHPSPRVNLGSFGHTL